MTSERYIGSPKNGEDPEYLSFCSDEDFIFLLNSGSGEIEKYDRDGGGIEIIKIPKGCANGHISSIKNGNIFLCNSKTFDLKISIFNTKNSEWRNIVAPSREAITFAKYFGDHIEFRGMNKTKIKVKTGFKLGKKNSFDDGWNFEPDGAWDEFTLSNPNKMKVNFVQPIRIPGMIVTGLDWIGVDENESVLVGARASAKNGNLLDFANASHYILVYSIPKGVQIESILTPEAKRVKFYLGRTGVVDALFVRDGNWEIGSWFY